LRHDPADLREPASAAQESKGRRKGAPRTR
jgi:hypothetical protein